MSQRVAIDYERDGREVRGLAAWRVLEHFGGQADEDVLESVKQRLPVALKDFPALAHETVNVGVLYENTDDKFCHRLILQEEIENRLKEKSGEVQKDE